LRGTADRENVLRQYARPAKFAFVEKEARNMNSVERVYDARRKAHVLTIVISDFHPLGFQKLSMENIPQDRAIDYIRDKPMSLCDGVLNTAEGLLKEIVEESLSLDVCCFAE
jgi:hypothetical protein